MYRCCKMTITPHSSVHFRFFNAKTKQSLEEIHQLLYQFREMKGMHLWLKARKKHNQNIPTNSEEMALMSTDPSGIPLIKFM